MRLVLVVSTLVVGESVVGGVLETVVGGALDDDDGVVSMVVDGDGSLIPAARARDEGDRSQWPALHRLRKRSDRTIPILDFWRTATT